MLAPGFTARELPVKISNVNNLRFTPDGRLTALGYDGRVHILSDSDGDGLEDKDTLFWDKPTLSVPVERPEAESSRALSAITPGRSMIRCSAFWRFVASPGRLASRSRDSTTW